MKKKTIATKTPHTLPKDMRDSLSSTPKALIAWEQITLLARNEWICWITSAKKQETRNHRIKRMCEELQKGKRRPCCWAGCIHRGK